MRAIGNKDMHSSFDACDGSRRHASSVQKASLRATIVIFYIGMYLRVQTDGIDKVGVIYIIIIFHIVTIHVHFIRSAYTVRIHSSCSKILYLLE